VDARARVREHGALSHSVEEARVLYIVLIAVARGRAEEWESYMADEHVGDMMGTGCFQRAYMARDEEADSDDAVGWRVIYVLEGQAELDRYLAEHAAAMRDDHASRFAGAVQARREILPVVARG
jgi:hypothetical protein